jgi:hypothetical protein
LSARIDHNLSTLRNFKITKPRGQTPRINPMDKEPELEPTEIAPARVTGPNYKAALTETQVPLETRLALKPEPRTGPVRIPKSRTGPVGIPGSRTGPIATNATQDKAQPEHWRNTENPEHKRPKRERSGLEPRLQELQELEIARQKRSHRARTRRRSTSSLWDTVTTTSKGVQTKINVVL